MKIVHITSAHKSDDIRIYYKMCCSLAKHGYEVHLIAPSKAKDNFTLNSVYIHPVKIRTSRISRMINTVKDIMKIGINIKGDIYHFHDPEIMIIALIAQRKYKKPFIFDVHEDYRETFNDKKWVPKVFRKPLKIIYGIIEDIVCKNLSGIVTATPSIAERFTKCKNVEIVQNYPLLSEIISNDEVLPKKKQFVYIGGLDVDRGVVELINAVKVGKFKLVVAGKNDPYNYISKNEKENIINNLEYIGEVDRVKVNSLLKESMAGIILFHPLKNHIKSQPTKLYEYMAAKLPIIVSNFPMWQKIVENARCGICVDPKNVNDIVKAMKWILDNKEKAIDMGNRGKELVLGELNWEKEFIKLNYFYSKILSKKESVYG